MVTFDPHLVIPLYGGLGNQLFGVAFGAQQALVHNRRVTFLYPPHGFGNISHGDFAPEVFFLDHPRIDYSRETRFARVVRLVGSFLGNRLLRGSFMRKTYMSETEFLETSRASRFVNETVVVDGLFQHRAYVEELRSQNKLFQLIPRHRQLEEAPILAKIQDTNTFCIHARRGDYLKIPSAKVLGVDYFSDALRALGALPNARVVVFSDSPNVVFEELLALSETFEVEVVPKSLEAANALFLMSQANNLIISNSTFSWWAAVSGRAGKRVVFPEGYFDENLVPPGWIAS